MYIHIYIYVSYIQIYIYTWGGRNFHSHTPTPCCFALGIVASKCCGIVTIAINSTRAQVQMTKTSQWSIAPLPPPENCCVAACSLCCSMLQCDAECCNVLQCVAVCCSVLQCLCSEFTERTAGLELVSTESTNTSSLLLF